MRPEDDDAGGWTRRKPQGAGEVEIHRDEDAAFPAQTFSGVKWDPILGGRNTATSQWCRMDDWYFSAK